MSVNPIQEKTSVFSFQYLVCMDWNTKYYVIIFYYYIYYI